MSQNVMDNNYKEWYNYNYKKNSIIRLFEFKQQRRNEYEENVILCDQYYYLCVVFEY